MLIFVLNSQLLSVSGDSKTLTRMYGWSKSVEAKIRGWRWENIFGFVVFYVAISLHIYTGSSIRKFICKCSLIYSYIHEEHTHAGIDQFNLIFPRFYFHFFGYCTPLVRWALAAFELCETLHFWPRRALKVVTHHHVTDGPAHKWDVEEICFLLFLLPNIPFRA